MTTTSSEEHLQGNGAELHCEDRPRRKKEDFPPRIRRKEASEYFFEVWGITVAPNTLAKQAVQGTGPKYRKFGPWPFYDTDSLDEYAVEKLGSPRRSTSDNGTSALSEA